VIALQKHLTAAANAHELVAEIVETGGRIARANAKKDGETEQGAMQGAVQVKIWSQRHSVNADFRL
jgi:hypothetical protein